MVFSLQKGAPIERGWGGSNFDTHPSRSFKDPLFFSSSIKHNWTIYHPSDLFEPIGNERLQRCPVSRAKKSDWSVSSQRSSWVHKGQTNHLPRTDVFLHFLAQNHHFIRRVWRFVSNQFYYRIAEVNSIGLSHGCTLLIHGCIDCHDDTKNASSNFGSIQKDHVHHYIYYIMIFLPQKRVLNLQ